MERTSSGFPFKERSSENSTIEKISGTIPRLQQLRAATSEMHGRLDRSVTAAGYFDNTIRYTDYISRLLRFQRAFDIAAVGIRDDWIERWSIANRAQWLLDDLSSLGQEPLPRRAPELRLESQSELLGALYVVIGAGLGARVLVQRAVAAGLQERNTTHYLSGLSTTTEWAKFIAFLETTTHINDAPLCAGAIATFECAYRHLVE